MPQLRRIVFAEREGTQEEVLLGEVPHGVESQASESGELEEHGPYMRLSAVWKRIRRHTGIRTTEKIL